MNSSDLAWLRLHNQLIIKKTSISPAEVVRHLGMIQAQDYLGALWAVGLRAHCSSEVSIEKALTERAIVRTWPARGTLHFVASEDVRWITQLLTPRVIAGNKGRYHQLGLDEETFVKSRLVFLVTLRGGNQLTREELFQALNAAGISTEGQRGAHMLGWNSAKGVICFGPRHGKQQSFVLLDEWLPQTKELDYDQSLSALVLCYFTSHGPATLKDFAWWSGLTKTEAKKGVEMTGEALVKSDLDGEDYWMSAGQALKEAVTDGMYLLPPFDEFLVGYTDRTAVLAPEFANYVNNGGGILHPAIVMNGMVVGTWKRTIQKKSVVISPSWFTQPTQDQLHLFEIAASTYADFLNLQLLIA